MFGSKRETIAVRGTSVEVFATLYINLKSSL